MTRSRPVARAAVAGSSSADASRVPTSLVSRLLRDQASGDGPGQVLEDERRDKAMGDGRSCTGRAGFLAEADCRSGGEAEDAIYHLCAEWVL